MNIFDVIGPVMIGPSSSHTAGAVRLPLFWYGGKLSVNDVLYNHRRLDASVFL